ncbi:MAG: lipid IV(A) 3-deoxy-D-manno-octulosonic acid transferase [Pseudomonadota bacterium]
MPAIYSSLLRALTPLAFARLWWKGRGNPAYRKRWGERLGRIPDLPERPRLWVHAVSVGEAIAASPLVRAWRARHPDWAVLVTTTTPTGSAQVRRLFGDAVEHVYLPFDLPGAVRRFLAHARPTLGVIMETELWPNLFAEADRRGIPLMLANARLSERSMRGYSRVGGLVRPTLSHLRLIAARGPEDAARFLALGAAPDRVEALGNLKFDLDVLPEVIEHGKAWRAMLGQDCPVWIAASTHPGEDEQVLAAHRMVLATHPDAMLLLAPRHPERADEVARLIEARAFRLVRRSVLSPSPPAPLPSRERGTIILIDTLGELMDFYAASDVAFVGGSLVPHGGHNPLEPAALGLPVLTGPHVHNFNEVFDAMRARGAAREVMDAHALGMAVAELLEDATRRRAMGEAGKTWMEAHRGALDRLVGRLESLVGAPPPAR